MLYGQFFKIYTHSCFLCLETTATSHDKILVACTLAHLLEEFDRVDYAQ
jgi:hypothetical protein